LLRRSGLPFRCRCLSYEFDVSADDPQQHAALLAALGAFRSSGNAEVTYRIADRGVGQPDDHRYSVLVDGTDTRWSDQPGVVLDWLLWHINYEASTREHDAIVIHAGSVVAPGGGVLLMPAASGSGKSTMTLGLLRAGFGYLSEEFAILDPDTALVRAYPRPLALKPGTRAMFPDLDASALVRPATHGETAHVPVGAVQVGPTPPGPPLDPRWVVMLRHVPGAGTTLTSLTPAQTLLGAASNTVAFRAHGQRALDTLAVLARRVSGWELSVDKLEDGVRALVELTAR
jgi:hypothetical protein